MTVINFDFTAVSPAAAGTVDVRPLRRTVGDTTVLVTAPVEVAIAAGVGTVTVPADLTVYWQFQERLTGVPTGEHRWRTYQVPASGAVAFPSASIVELAEWSLDPLPEPGTALDAEVASRVAADGLLAASVTSLDTYARRGAAFGPLKRALTDGTRSTAIQVLGDSTGNDSDEWPALLAAHLAAAYPAWTVHRRLWDDATQAYAAPTVVQTGTAGIEALPCDGVLNRRTPSVHLAAVIDVRVKCSLPDWTPGTARTLVGQAQGAANRSWYVSVTATGGFAFTFSTDGAAVTAITATSLIPFADGATGWLRVLFNPNDGAGNRVTKFYTGTDGVAWTQLGSTVTTAAPVTLFNAANADPLYGFNIGGISIGAATPWPTGGVIYEAQIRNGDTGPLVAPALPSLWQVTTIGQLAVTGAPTLTLVNGSFAGAGITYLGDATRLPKLTPAYGQAITFLSTSHNESAKSADYWTDTYETWRAAVAARVPAVPIVAMTQNPENGATFANAHALRRLDLLAYGRDRGLPVIDTYKAFLDYGAWAANLMADTVHPNAAGSVVWAAVVTDAFDAA